jgi:hypothetical protein
MLLHGYFRHQGQGRSRKQARSFGIYFWEADDNHFMEIKSKELRDFFYTLDQSHVELLPLIKILKGFFSVRKKMLACRPTQPCPGVGNGRNRKEALRRVHLRRKRGSY